MLLRSRQRCRRSGRGIPKGQGMQSLLRQGRLHASASLPASVSLQGVRVRRRRVSRLRRHKEQPPTSLHVLMNCRRLSVPFFFLGLFVCLVFPAVRSSVRLCNLFIPFLFFLVFFFFFLFVESYFFFWLYCLSSCIHCPFVSLGIQLHGSFT